LSNRRKVLHHGIGGGIGNVSTPIRRIDILQLAVSGTASHTISLNGERTASDTALTVGPFELTVVRRARH